MSNSAFSIQASPPLVTSVTSGGSLTISPTTGSVVANLNLANINHWTDTTDSTVYTTGSMIFDGGIGVAKQIRTNTSVSANTSISAGTTILAGATSKIGLFGRSAWFSSADGSFQARNSANSADSSIAAGAGTFTGNITNTHANTSLVSDQSSIAGFNVPRILFSDASGSATGVIDGGLFLRQATNAISTEAVIAFVDSTGANTSTILVDYTGGGDMQITPKRDLYLISGNFFLANSLELGGGTDTTISRVSAGVIAVEGVTVPTISSTNTFTNKRITRREVSVSDATSITPNIDTSDVVTQVNTQIIGTLTMNAPTGTPTAAQQVTIRIKSTNVQTFSWNAIYRGGTTALPATSTGSSKTDYYDFIYNSTDSKYDFLRSSTGF